METPQDVRNARLLGDYSEMCNIRGSIIQWRAVKGAPPYVEEYELTVNIRSIISARPDYRDQHVIKIELPGDYPRFQPAVIMVSMPVVFNPNWWGPKKNYEWCPGSWDFSEGLGHHVIRMLRTLQYDPNIINVISPANGDANKWYKENRHRNLFPCDRQILPDPMNTNKFRIQAPVKKRFDIQ